MLCAQTWHRRQGTRLGRVYRSHDLTLPVRRLLEADFVGKTVLIYHHALVNLNVTKGPQPDLVTPDEQ